MATLSARSLIRLLPALALALLLGACTVYVEDGRATVRSSLRGRIDIGVPTDAVITRFSTLRGDGARYEVGENVAFRIRTAQSGYVTLTAIDPDGDVYVFARNIPVEAGETEIIAGPTPRQRFTLAPPRGLHRVRASFTPEPTNVTRVTYRGERGEEAWNRTITVDVGPYRVRDVAETYFYVR